MKMFGECHAHIFLNGYDYRKAVETQKNGPRDALIRAHLEEYRKRGIRFVRDGGDHYGVSKRAARLAPEYEIDYRTPVFAIYKEGHYGKIVGKSFSDMKEYHRRVLEAAAEGADFIKIMTTGLLDFADHGKITGTPLSVTDVKEMVHIAHEEGFAVMSHTNGCYGVQAAVEAGVDSIEHGNYMDDETISMLADSESVWVPTLVTVRNLKGCGRFEDTILASIIKAGEQNLKKAFEKKVHVAVGSDAGAYQVLHGQGVQDESRAFFDILGDTQAVRSWMEDGEKRIRTIFRHGSSNLIQVSILEVRDFAGLKVTRRSAPSSIPLEERSGTFSRLQRIFTPSYVWSSTVLAVVPRIVPVTVEVMLRTESMSGSSPVIPRIFMPLVDSPLNLPV